MGSFINSAILFDPVNWIIVVLVLVFVGYGFYVVTQNAGVLLPKLPSA